MRDILEAIAKTVRKIVSRIYLPLVSSAVMLCIENSVGREIPHLRVPVLHVLFHAKKSLLGSVFALSHCAKLGE